MDSAKPHGRRLRLIEGGLSQRSTGCRYLLAQGRLMQRFYQGGLIVHGALSVHAVSSFEQFLDSLEQTHYDGLLIDAEWENGVHDAVRLLQTVRAIEVYSGEDKRPVVICTTKTVGWPVDAIDGNVRIYELAHSDHHGLPQDLVEFLLSTAAASDSAADEN